MSFADIFYYLYILLMITGLIGLWLWLLKFTKNLKLSSGQSNLIFLGAMLTAFVIGVGLAVKLNQWRRANSPTLIGSTATSSGTSIIAKEQPVPQQPVDEQNLTEEQRLIRYETENYPKLHEQRLALYEEMKVLNKFFNDLRILSEQLPKQRHLLAGIQQIRRGTSARLNNCYLVVGQELRRFWVHYVSVNPRDAENKFKPQADILIAAIQEIRGDTLDDKRQEEVLINQHIQDFTKLLKTNQLPDVNAGITSYTDQNRLLVLNGMREPVPENLRTYLQQLASDRVNINQHLAQIKHYQDIYPDLRDSLEKTAKLWREALQHNLYTDYRLMYGLEIEYVLEQLNIDSAATPRKRLREDLLSALPRMMDNITVKMADAEEAYSPTLKSKPTKANTKKH